MQDIYGLSGIPCVRSIPHQRSFMQSCDFNFSSATTPLSPFLLAKLTSFIDNPTGCLTPVARYFQRDHTCTLPPSPKTLSSSFALFRPANAQTSMTTSSPRHIHYTLTFILSL